MKPNVEFLDTKNNQYLYDGNTGKIMVINQLIKLIIEDYWGKEDVVIINELSGRFSITGIKQTISTIEEAKGQGLLTEYPKEIYLDTIINELRYDLENNISGVCLSVTQNCNLRCEYCVYSGIYDNNRIHSSKTMTFEVAKKAIDYAISKSSSKEVFTLSFYGGEPLLRFDLIQKCI